MQMSPSPLGPPQQLPKVGLKLETGFVNWQDLRGKATTVVGLGQDH